jgi:cupin fold WbuC family metalloprotein
MLEGEVLIPLFNDRGDVTECIGLKAPPGSPSLYRLKAPCWHSLIVVSEIAVFHEVATGPFVPAEEGHFIPKEDQKSWALGELKLWVQ